MRNTPPKQSLNYDSSTDLSSPCLPSLGSQMNKTKLHVGSNSVVPSHGVNDKPNTSGNSGR
ncbi:hypothetical protein RHMOL_Rhmol01G0273100 [Rhododendron molle]|uniref:Uncharacterized protein n=1 Tax=Rhododendron molle TaxID=49168 RepID=A0ACC0Q9H0_RHOML|nr:hypothetical protein RHMOL_Rhmol01G0273100 [Rhododendron molle]